MKETDGKIFLKTFSNPTINNFNYSIFLQKLVFPNSINVLRVSKMGLKYLVIFILFVCTIYCIKILFRVLKNNA